MYNILVNKSHKIGINNFKLINIKNYKNKTIKIEEKTYENYLKLKKYLEKLNIIVDIDTAYRSIEEQEEICKEYLEKYGEEYTKRYAALPGYSEHHTGLAVDLVLKVNNIYIDTNEELLKQKEIFKIIHENLYKFGFILRYPKGKENITGYNYEPWHIRYVENAEYIYKNNLVLEDISN